ncbi:BA14K family protein [Mesorhizobium sp. B2-5-9]|nr:BA14K family protein [Mesorhizobium sp. B2-5-9]TPK80006.1 BA14K family protein [Mesorhizobium sp. B2-4-13]
MKRYSMMRSMLAIVVALGTVVPASAVPAFVPKVQSASSDVVPVRYDRNRLMFRRNHGYWRGHRGYRHHRPGYRRHNGWWFPPAAFALGAIIGGAMSQPHVVGNRHIRWCYDHYRSYRASDNTFQPYHGPRRQCRSPYD